MQQNRKMKSENVRKNGFALCMFDQYLSWLGTIGELLGKWVNQKHRKIDNCFPDHDLSIGCITSHQQTVDLPRETWHGVLTIVDLTTTGLLISTNAWICLSYLKLSVLSNKERMTELEKKTDEAKQKRVSQKIARSEDQEERKKWVKWQAILHTYGAENEDDGSEENRTLVQEAEHLMGGEETVIVSGRKCRCGSTTHLRTSSRLCPLNKNNAN